MASDPRVRVTRAFKAMKAIGISEIKVKPVLKKLLKLYEKNWELIEEENYRVLADAIFDEEDDAKGSGQTKSKIDEENFEDEAQEEPQPPLKRVRRGQEPQVPPSSSNSSPSLGGALLIRPKVEEDELPTTSSQHQSQDNVNSPRFTAGNGRAEIQRLRNKGKEPVSVSALVASTENRCIPEISSHALSIREPAVEPENILLRKKVSGTQELIRPKDEPFTDDMFIDNRPQYEIPIAVIHPDSIDKGDSSSGNVLLEEQVCQGSPAAPHLDGEYRVDGVPASSSDRRSNNELTTIPEENPSSLEIASSPIGEERLGTVTPCHLLKKSTALDDALLAPQCQLTSDELRAINYGKDITKGEERVEIPWVNEVNSDRLPTFYYIVQNLVYQNASVNFSLSQIDAEHCCSDCFGNCLASASTVACACARQTGKFVYTPEGLLDEEFLAECVSMTRDPQQQHLLNCIDCPLEISKNVGILEPCKGHIERNIIKECWRKCGCYKQCGNRVVQRGINSKMQVFYTPEEKGWGIRTLEKLPKGAFVCEFVGEIVTIKELYDRNTKKHNCPVVLDAYWVPKKVLKEEEALCLDATCYGNVARFLNHRCFDANLIEIPVEIETPEHHYYHLAFFTTREVDALEELTWDYGIDFDDHDHLFKPFQCRCGSKFCRNMKRSSRSRCLATAR